MTYFGETIRNAREAKGLTASQVAEKTHIIVQIVEAMEKEDFKRIKAAIYGRGFVKLICDCLDLDPAPLIADFMDIYEGRRPPMPGNVPFAGGKSPAAEQAPSPVEPAYPEPEETAPAASPDDDSLKGLDLFDPPQDSPEQQSATRTQNIFSATYTAAEPPTPTAHSAADKFRTGLSVVSHGVLGSVRGIPRSAWRMAVLAVGATAVLILLVWGCVVLYRVTEQPAPSGANEPSATVQPAKPAPQSARSTEKSEAKPDSKPVKATKLRSTGQNIPPLYVD